VDAPDGKPTPGLDIPSPERLVSLRLGFEGLVRLLERLTSEAVRVGEQGPPTSEGLRFHHDPSLSFHTGDVVALTLSNSAADPESEVAPSHPVYHVTSSFLGLSGSVSPLPAYFAEELVFEDADNPVRRDFLDLFHHRFLSLFFRSVVRYRLSAEHTAELKDSWSRRAFALLGIDTYQCPPPGKLGSARLLQFAPLLAHKSRGPRALEVGLQVALEEHLNNGAGVRVEECFGRWTEVDAPSWTRLGKACTTLGQDLLLGRRIFDRAGSFAVHVGPVTWRVYERFREGGDLLGLVEELVGWLVRDPLDYTLVITLLPREAPGLQLTAAGTSRLGRNAWLLTRAEETVLVVDPRRASA
jgi:type VI secretion system protein ImpH